MSLVLKTDRCWVLKTRTADYGDSVVGLYPDEEEFIKVMNRVELHMKTKGFETNRELHQFGIPTQ